MMANKWMQTGIFFGITIGLVAGLLLSSISPLVPFAVAYVFGFLTLYWGGNAKGTDGWGGPWHGPVSEKAKAKDGDS